MRCTELTLMTVALAIMAATQWVASAGGSLSVRATTRSACPSIYYIGPANDGSVFRNGHQIDSCLSVTLRLGRHMFLVRS